MDRWALGVALQNIKLDLHLSDTQLGFLSGIAFALFYAVMGIPIARWADRGNRVTIISLTVAVWSVMVALCGMAASFVQLLLIRVGVAVGEAGCIPPAHSLIADYFNRAERPRAVSIYMQGAPLSVVIGYFLAGWLNEFYGWRMMFMIVGLPGLVLAALAWFTLREPRDKEPARDVLNFASASMSKTERAASTHPSLIEVGVTLWANTTFRHLLIYFSLWYFFGYGMGQWQPAFFIRSYGLKTGELGTWFAAVFGFGGLLGTYWGGELASRYAAHNERLQLKAMAIANDISAVLWVFVYVSPNKYLAFGLTALSTIIGSALVGPIFATTQTLMPQRMRAVSIAMIYLFANFIGMGLGPVAAGVLSDGFRHWVGEASLRYALLALCPGYFWAGWHLRRASKTVTRDVAAVHAEEAPALH